MMMKADYRFNKKAQLTQRGTRDSGACFIYTRQGTWLRSTAVNNNF